MKMFLKENISVPYKIDTLHLNLSHFVGRMETLQ